MWHYRRGARHLVSEGPQQAAEDEGAKQGRDSANETKVGRKVSVPAIIILKT